MGLGKLTDLLFSTLMCRFRVTCAATHPQMRQAQAWSFCSSSACLTHDDKCGGLICSDAWSGEFILGKSAAQCTIANPEKLRRLALVPARLGQGRTQRLHFTILKNASTATRSSGSTGSRQNVLNSREVSRQNVTRNHALQFPHVAGPPVAKKAPHRFWRQRWPVLPVFGRIHR